MTRVHRSRVLAASPKAVWDVVGDAHHLPRWWPGVRRVEDVRPEGWTEVLYTRRGRPVRADFTLVTDEPPYRRIWQQEVVGTPFERVLAASVIEVAVEPDAAGSEVTIEHRQQLKGYSRTGAWMLRRATGRKLDEALDGLAGIVG